jgi:hypothetical protein
MAVASGLLNPLGARLMLVVSGGGGIAAGAVGWAALRHGGKDHGDLLRMYPGDNIG